MSAFLVHPFPHADLSRMKAPGLRRWQPMVVLSIARAFPAISRPRPAYGIIGLFGTRYGRLQA